ncbi:MAG: trypsin-like peptidase domain-containing protein [Phycisphaeraceae bacterium]
MNRIRWYGPTLVLLVTVLTVILTGPELARRIAWAHQDARITLIREDLDQSPVLDEMSRAFRNVAEVVKPSVVNIRIMRRADGRVQGRSELEQLLPDLFERFERRQQPDQNPPQPEQDIDPFSPSRPAGHGSGWVYDEQGHIVTNNHVIRNADEIVVEFVDGRTYVAEVAAVDVNTDIAVLRINATDVHPARVATEEVEQGDIVFAFGSPFRFDFSMSQGIISGRARQLGILGQRGYENFIQTDAAINPGNSGGPLTNIRGEVVGMNTAIAQDPNTPFQAPGFQGVSFAIPVALVVEIADQLIDDGRVVRGFLGIAIDDLTERQARAFGLDDDAGVLVHEPMPGLPAAKAGIQPEDIITAVDGEPVATAGELRFRIARTPPGREVVLTIFRDGEYQDVAVVLGELTDDRTAARPRPGRAGEGGAESDRASTELLRRMGIDRVDAFTEQHARELGTEPIDGVVITRVRPNSLASQAGLRPGSVIRAVMGEPVTSVAQLSERVQAFADADGDIPLRLAVAQWDPRDRRFRLQSLFIDLPR